MKKGGLILLLGVLLCAGTFAGFYYSGTSCCRGMMKESQPELAWLKKEFSLSDAEFKRVSELHAAYLPHCAERCRHLDELNTKLHHLLAATNYLTPEIQALLTERANTRSDCEAEMLKHFLEVSRTMPPEQGRRYLAWAEQQSVLHPQSMEQAHHEAQPVPHHEHH
jgi:hypothetical protein